MATAALAVSSAKTPLRYEATKKDSRDTSTLGLLTRFPKEKTTDFLKLGYVPATLGIRAGLLPADNEVLNNVIKVSKWSKLAISGFAEAPGKLYKAGKSIEEFAKKPSGQSLVKATFDSLDSVAPVTDAIELVDYSISKLPANVVTVSKVANFGALGLVMTKSAIESGKKIYDASRNIRDVKQTEAVKANEKDKRWQALIDLAKSVSFIVLAVIGFCVALSLFAFSAPIALAMAAASTSALVASIWGYFNKNVVDPDGRKGINDSLCDKPKIDPSLQPVKA